MQVIFGGWIVSFIGIAMIGWIINVVKLAYASGDQAGLVIARIFGLFIPPLGALLGFF